MWAVSKILILLACTRLSGSRDVMKTSSRENRTRVIREEGVAAGFLSPQPRVFFVSVFTIAAHYYLWSPKQA